MAEANTRKARPWYMPRFPLEMAIASLATLLATTLYFDLPHRLRVAVPPVTPVPEKLVVQAQPLPVQRSSADADATRFMEAVALSHVAPLLPQSRIDESVADPGPSAVRAIEPSPPPAVQVLARAPARDRPKPAAPPPVHTAQPMARPATSQTSGLTPLQVPGAEPRPPGVIPVNGRPADRRGLHVPVVSDVANMAGSAITSGVDSIGRGIDWILLPHR